RIKRRQVVEQDLVPSFIGRFKIDRLDLYQRKVFLTLMRWTDLAANGVAGFEVEFADLRGRDVNVVRSGQVVVIGRAEEAISVRQDFQHTLGKDVPLFFALRLQDLEDEVLLSEPAGARQIK